MPSPLDRFTHGSWDIPAEIRRLCQIPSQFRLFSFSPAEAETVFGLRAATLQALIAAGLPRRGAADTMQFDTSDLMYLSLRLGTARASLAGFAFVAKSLDRFAAHGSTELSVRYVPTLSDASQRLNGTVALPNGHRREVELQHNVVAAEVIIRLTSGHPPTPPELVNALADAPALDLYNLRPPLQGDTTFARQTGLGDCFTAAHLVAECCGSLGYEVRVVGGLLAAVPWSNLHYWCEVCVEGEWLPLDPLLIRTLTTFASLDSDVWPSDRSCTPVLARFPPGAIPLVARRDGTHIEARFPTTFRGAFDWDGSKLAGAQISTG